MVKRPIIVNTSRGPVIDSRSGALETGQISEAGLDVVETEPRSSLLLKMENVVSHTAFYSRSRSH
jgi:lactate dehydrogenase-like 2-hydroxyacid dehydrogenase